MFKTLEISIGGLLTIRSWQIFGIGAGLSQTVHLSAIEHTHFHPLKPVIPNQGYEYAGVSEIGMLGMMLIAPSITPALRIGNGKCVHLQCDFSLLSIL